MSADNYMLVDVDETNRGFVVYNASASSEDHPSKYSTGRFFTDVLEAIDYAHDEYSEYGVTLSPEVRNELIVAKIKKDAAALTGFGWQKSDGSVTSHNRDGWSFVAHHAEEIVRFLNKRE